MKTSKYTDLYFKIPDKFVPLTNTTRSCGRGPLLINSIIDRNVYEELKRKKSTVENMFDIIEKFKTSGFGIPGYLTNANPKTKIEILQILSKGEQRIVQNKDLISHYITKANKNQFGDKWKSQQPVRNLSILSKRTQKLFAIYMKKQEEDEKTQLLSIPIFYINSTPYSPFIFYIITNDNLINQKLFDIIKQFDRLYENGSKQIIIPIE